VGVDGDNVAIFNGKPGGVLWIQPSLAEDSDLLVVNVPAVAMVDLENGVEQPSLKSARSYIDKLIEQNATTTTTSSTSTSTSSTTTSSTTTSIAQ
jgi:hypothetical protein